MKNRISVLVSTLLLTLPLAEGSTRIKFGKISEGDVVMHAQDIDISWNGGYYDYANGNSGAGGSLGSFRGQSAGAVIVDSITTSGLSLSLSAVNGNTNDTIESNNNGTLLAVIGGADGSDGDLAKRIIDENESVELRFNKDVLIKGAGAMANGNYGSAGAEARITAGGSTLAWTVSGTAIESYYYKDASNLFVAANSPVTLWTEDDGTADNTGWSLSMLLVQTVGASSSLTLQAINREGSDVSGQNLVDSDHIHLQVSSPSDVTNYTYQLLEQTASPSAADWSVATEYEFLEDLWFYREPVNQWVRIRAADKAGASIDQVIGLQGGTLTAPPDDPISAIDYVDRMGPGLIVEADSYADVGPEVDCVEIKKAGFNHVRMHIGRLNKSKDAANTPANNPDYYTNLDRWIQQIARHGMLCHIGNKGSSVMELTWEDDKSAEWQQAYHDEMYDWWVEVADHCKFMSHRLAYHLFLETGGNSFMSSADALNAFHSAITEPIRLDDASRLIIYPPPRLNDATRLVEMNFPYPDLNPGDGITTGSGEYWFADFHRRFAGGRSFMTEADLQLLDDNVQAAIDWMDANDKPLIMSAVRPTNSNSKHDEYISHRVRFIEYLYSRLDTAKYPIRITWLSHDNYNFENGLGWRPGMRVLLEAMNRDATVDPDDPDGDLISTADEINLYGTNPYLADTDQDNILDTFECTLAAFNPTDPSDGHVISDGGHNTDFDGDGLGNAWEMLHAVKWGENPLTEPPRFDPLNPADALADQDGDGVPNIWERILRINPNDDRSITEDDGTDDWDKDLTNTLAEITVGSWPMASSSYDRDYDALTGDIDPMPYIHDAGHVAGYVFNDDAADSSSQGGNDGTLMNGAHVSGGVALLDGVDDRIDIDSSDFGSSSNRSINLHFWAAQPGGVQELYREGGTNSGMRIYLDGADLWMGIWNQPQEQFVKISTVSPQQWHAVTVSFDGEKNRFSGWLFSGNTRVVETNLTTSILTVGDAAYAPSLGGSIAGCFSGYLDDVHLYSRGLNPVEAAQLSRNDLHPLKQPPQIATLPYFTEHPLPDQTAVVGEEFSLWVTNRVFDPNGDALTFALESGPAWMNVASNGLLSGLPAESDVGINDFVILVSDDIHGQDAAPLKIEVKKLSAPVQFAVLEDTYVQKNKPDENFGTDSVLTMRNSFVSGFARVPYLKFSVSNLTTSVGRAVLKLYSTDSSAPVTAYAIHDNSWTELGVVWSNRPAFGEEIGSAVAVADEWFEIDVTEFITTNGVFSIALDEQENLVSKLTSREGGQAAYIEIRTELPVLGTYYEQWGDSYGLVESNRAYDVDADGDGLVNLHEYALGGNPVTGVDVPSLSPSFEVMEVGASNVVEYIYRRRTDAEQRGLEYHLEVSTNLVTDSWHTNGPYVVGTVLLEPGFEAVTNHMNALSKEQFFQLRIKMNQ